MSSNPALAEAFPLEDPEFKGPELHVHEGGGEGGADVPAPDLYAVPDPADSLPGATVMEVPAGADVEIDDEPEIAAAEEPEADGEEADTDRRTAAKRAGRILRSVTAAESTAVSYQDDEQHRRGGGGGWAFREYLRKLAEKEEAARTHISGCRCEYCLS